MHRSRLCVALIDHPEDSHDAGLAFWAGATGRRPAETGPDEPFHSLGAFAGGFHVATQRTGSGTPPRMHLDFETDDVDAEVARLEALGARRLRQVEDMWQLTDPGGLVFCVVPVQTAEFDTYAKDWE